MHPKLYERLALVLFEQSQWYKVPLKYSAIKMLRKQPQRNGNLYLCRSINPKDEDDAAQFVWYKCHIYDNKLRLMEISSDDTVLLSRLHRTIGDSKSPVFKED